MNPTERGRAGEPSAAGEERAGEATSPVEHSGRGTSPTKRGRAGEPSARDLQVVSAWLRRRWFVTGALVGGVVVATALSRVIDKKQGFSLFVLAAFGAVVATGWILRTARLARLASGNWTETKMSVQHREVRMKGGRQRFEFVLLDDDRGGTGAPRSYVRAMFAGGGLPLAPQTTSARIVGAGEKWIILVSTGPKPLVFHRPDGLYERRLAPQLSEDGHA